MGIAPPVTVRVVQALGEAIVVIAHRVDDGIIALLDGAHALQERVVFRRQTGNDPSAGFRLLCEIATESLRRNAAGEAQFGDPLHVGKRGDIQLSAVGEQVVRQLHVQVLERIPHAAITGLRRILAVTGGVRVLFVTLAEPKPAGRIRHLGIKGEMEPSGLDDATLDHDIHDDDGRRNNAYRAPLPGGLERFPQHRRQIPRLGLADIGVHAFLLSHFGVVEFFLGQTRIEQPQAHVQQLCLWHLLDRLRRGKLRYGQSLLHHATREASAQGKRQQH